MNNIYYHSSNRMPELSDESIHLVVTSPPYPMIEKWDDSLAGWTNEYQDKGPFWKWYMQHETLYASWQECYRVLIDGGIMCVNIGDATRSMDGQFRCYPNYAKLMMDCVNLGMTPLIPIFWKKISNRPNAFLGSGMLPTSGYVSQDCEYIAILRKGLPRKFKPKDETRYASAFTKEERDLWFQQIWCINGKTGAGKTSSFPREIPYRLIRMFSVLGDTVLDPFGGTMVTGDVAEELGRNFIGYEVNPDAT